MTRSDSKSKASAPDFDLERSLQDSGARLVAGVDEAGRGPLAGPVVVAAVVLDPDSIPQGLNDSKELSEARREALFSEIMASARVSIVSAPPAVIDTLNIRGATLRAMAQAVRGLEKAPCHALIDGRDIPPGLPCPADFVIGGDAKSVSIAAASIVAKVMRDRMCAVMDCDAGTYEFARHKGYGTARHLEALTTQGPSAHHRQSFAPVAQTSMQFS